MSPHHPSNVPLRGIRLFRSFDACELDELLEFAVPCRVSAGREIASHGDRSRSIFVVTDGEAVAVMRRPDGTEAGIGRFRAGDVFGEFAMPDGRQRNADVIAATDCTVMTITTGLMQMLGLAHPRTAFKLAMALLDLADRRFCAKEEHRPAGLTVVPAPVPGRTVGINQQVA
jgi:CRP-like cAMP-binding protein